MRKLATDLRDNALRFATLAILVLAGGWAAPNQNQDIGEGGNTMGFDMAPETNIEVVEGAVKQIPVKMAPGPIAPTGIPCARITECRIGLSEQNSGSSCISGSSQSRRT